MRSTFDVVKILWRNKFIFWNLVALIVVKAVFSFSGFQFASVINGISPFGKEEVVAQTNDLRIASGLGELKENSTLDRAAAEKLQDMIAGQYFAHTSPSGVTPWHWIETNKYKFIYAGENLAIGFSNAKSTVDAWFNSPSHRQNLLNQNYKEIGVAIAPAKIQNSEGFLVVQMFGTPSVPGVRPVAIAPKVAPQTIPESPPSLGQKSTTLGHISASSKTAESKQVETPTTVVASSPKLNKVSKTLNGALLFYALIVVLASAVVIAFVGIRKEFLVRTAAGFALLVLTAVIPVLHITHTALIL